MPNAIKYNVSAETLALKKGNFWIGTGDVSKGPTSSTGYYNGITPPSGGYTIYLNKVSGGPSIYTVTTEAQMVSLTNTIGAQSFTTSGQCLNWFATQTDKMIFNRDYEGIITNGLVMNLDAGFTPSYPTTETTWYDVSSTGNNGTLTNGPTYSSSNGGSIVFDGVDDYANNSNPSSLQNQNLTVSMWIKPSTATNEITTIVDYNHCSGCNWVVQSEDATSNRNYYFGYRSTSNVWEPSNGIGGGKGVQLSNFVWQNLVFTKNGTSIIGYLNGIQTYSATAGSPTILYLTGNLKLGAGSCDSRQFNGNMSNTQIYNRVLSATEVLQNYNAQKSRFGL
jgi:hypothetical protein